MQMKLKKILVDITWLGAAVLLLISAIASMLNNSSRGIVDMPDWVCILILVSGVLRALQFLLTRDASYSQKAFFNKAVFALILGVMLLMKNFFASEALRTIVAVFTLFDGIMVLNAAWESRKEKNPLLKWLWLVGGVEALLGVFCMTKDMMNDTRFGFAIGLCLLAEALSVGFCWAASSFGPRMPGKPGTVRVTKSPEAASVPEESAPEA